MNIVEQFRRAVERKDVDAILATLSADVTFHSPVMPRPYRGVPAVAPLLAALADVLDDFAYVAEFSGRGLHAGGPPLHALQFTATVDDKQITGIDILTTGEDDLITEVTVLARPVTAAHSLARLVGRRLVESPDPTKSTGSTEGPGLAKSTASTESTG